MRAIFYRYNIVHQRLEFTEYIVPRSKSSLSDYNENEYENWSMTSIFKSSISDCNDDLSISSNIPWPKHLAAFDSPVSSECNLIGEPEINNSDFINKRSLSEGYFSDVSVGTEKVNIDS